MFGVAEGSAPATISGLAIRTLSASNKRRAIISSPIAPSRTTSSLRLDKQHLGPFDPALSQIDAEPAVTVFRLEANGRPRPKFGQVVLSPRLAQVRRDGDARGKGGRRGAMPSQDHALLDD